MNCGFDFLVHAFTVVFGGHADGEALDPFTQVGGEIGVFPVGAGGVHLIVAAEDVVQHGHILHGASHGANLVQGGGKGNQAVAGNRTISGFEAHNAAVSGRLPDGAAGVGTQSQCRHAGGHRRGGTARGAAGNIVQVVGVVGLEEPGVLTGGTHGKFIHIQLAGHHGVGGQQFFHHSGVIGRHKVVQHLGSAGGEDVLGADVVLHRHGDARQGGQALPFGQQLVHRFGLVHSGIPGQGDIGFYLVLHRVNPGEHRLGDLGGAAALVPQHAGEFRR